MNTEQFWSFVEKGGPDDCWPWRGPRSFRFEGGEPGRPRRIAYRLTHAKEAPADEPVLITCTTKSCCNGAHLYVEGELNVSDWDGIGPLCPGCGYHAVRDQEEGLCDECLSIKAAVRAQRARA